MILMRVSFKVSLIVMISVVSGMEAKAREVDQEHIEKSGTLWKNLIPSHVKMQYAGGIGFISAGLGWDYGKSNRWETDVMLGFVPSYSTQRAKATFTLKQHFFAWNNRRISSRITIDPFAAGLAANMIMDGAFWVNEPDRYPDGYYSFSTKLRFWIHAGQRITLHLPGEKKEAARSITAFYEISSCDLYLFRAFANRSLQPGDYLRLAFGLKFHLF
ncbi:MAG: hypothetical protein LBH90_00485 [Tannerella sp.]|nr:hypothetical protein [Tannerella sp.]